MPIEKITVSMRICKASSHFEPGTIPPVVDAEHLGKKTRPEESAQYQRMPPIYGMELLGNRYRSHLGKLSIVSPANPTVVSGLREDSGV